jgi:aryl-alcohol dehydrogenase-like predicted oxidoreductase
VSAQNTRPTTIEFAGARFSRLGFGTSSFAGLGSGLQQAVLTAALDAGVSHFDTARSYGMGDAEAALGRLLKPIRDRVTITTKAGRVAPMGTPRFRLLRDTARAILKHTPAAKSFVSSMQGREQPAPPAIDASTLTRSLDESLRQLGTDHVDVFLLHDLSAADALRDDIMRLCGDAVQSGKARFAGIGSSAEAALAVANETGARYQVLQFENSVLNEATAIVDAARSRLAVTHRAISESFGLLRQYLYWRPDVKELWQRTLGVDVANGENLSRLMLEWSLSRNARGITLFSARDPERIKANARALSEPRFDDATLKTFAGLVRDIRRTAKALGTLQPHTS